MSFKLDQCPDCVVISINCTRDPVINRDLNQQYVEEVLPEVKFQFIQIDKHIIGHCTDMIYGDGFIHDIYTAIRHEYPMKMIQ